MNFRIKIAEVFVLAILPIAVLAQQNGRDHIRQGNKLYNDSLFVKAEVEYRKALDVDPKSTEARYNLGNALLMQQKAKEAMEQYEAASKMEENKTKLAKIYHNAGVVLQGGKQYAQCIDAYKQALRNNPYDHETRYNLALAQKMLKEQQQNQNNDQQKDQNGNDKKKDKEKEKQDNKQNQDQQKQDQNQKQNPDQQKQQQDKNQMSKENAEQLLNAVMQDEKNVQEKVKKKLQMRGKKYDKDW